MGPYGFWLFDLDGTLVDVEWSHVRSVFDEVGERLGRRFSNREAAAIWHGFAGDRNDVLEGFGVETEQFWEVFHDVEDPIRRAEATVLYEDARHVAAIDEPVGIVTHCQSYLTEAVLDRTGIGDWCDVVVCCDDDLGWKPDPTPVERAMDELGVTTAEHGALVGDGPHDVGAAWNANLDGIHVERHGHDRRGCCVLADSRVRTISDIDGIGGPPVASDGGFAVGCETIRTPPIP